MTWCLCWQAALVSTVLAIVIFLIWKRVSLVSILTAISYLIGTYIVWATGNADPYLLFFVAPVVLLLLIRHKDNIKRLLRGEEKAISSGDKH
jgi:glycerol-3-phosphate acyltransferase PlsY